MTEEIMALCRAMGAAENQEELLLPLVQAIQDKLTARLKAGVLPEDCGPAFPLAAAMMAMDKLKETTGSDQEVTSFTAGDLTIHKKSGGGQKLTVQAEELLSQWLEDTSFCFQGVRG